MINHDYEAARYSAGTRKRKIVELLKITCYYMLCYAMSLCAIDQFAFVGKTIIQTALIIGIIASLISNWLVAPDRPNQIRTLKQNYLLYPLVLLGAYFVIRMLNSIDGNMLGVSLGFSTGQVLNNSGLGWIQMMLQFIMIGTPIGHVLFEVKRIFTFYGFGYGHVTKRKRMEQLQKTIVKRK